jgi:hypothetical protein
MPIASYLGFPVAGCAPETAMRALEGIPYCRPELSSNGECLLLVTDTPDAEAEKELRERLGNCRELTGLTLVFSAEEEAA